MRRLLPILIVLLGTGFAGAQEQEKGLTERMKALPDMALVNPMQNQAYGSGKFGTKAFGSSTYGGVKNANVKTFETRSFLGVKNPWFGRKVFDTSASGLSSKVAQESREKFQTDTYAAKRFENGSKESLQDTTASLPGAAQPRPYLVAGKTQQGLDKFTQNLQKDLTIDDVRDLLNKGKGQ